MPNAFPGLHLEGPSDIKRIENSTMKILRMMIRATRSRSTERQRDRETERQRDRETERQREKT